jgi:hypothetical protein
VSFDAADGFVDNELFISEEHFAELSKEYGVPKADDIVITAIGTIGNAHVVRECDRFYFKDASVLWMKRTAEVSSEFVNLWLKSPVFFDQLDLDRSPVFYPDSFATEHSRYLLEEGDIIMSLTGTTGKEDYGLAVRIPDCGHTLLMNQRIMKFDAIRHDIIDDGYLLHYGERYTASKPVERDDEVASSATAFPERTESHRSPTRRPVRRNPTPRPPLRAEARRAGGAEEGAAAPGLCRGVVTERRRMPSIGEPPHGKKRRFPFHELANVIRKEPFLYRLRALAVNQVDEM